MITFQVLIQEIKGKHARSNPISIDVGKGTIVIMCNWTWIQIFLLSKTLIDPAMWLDGCPFEFE